MKKTLKAHYLVLGSVILTAVILISAFFLFSRSTSALIQDNTSMYLTENARAVAAIFYTKMDDQLVMLESQVRYFRDIDITNYNVMKDTILATKGIGAFKTIGVANSTGATINYNGKSSGNIMLTDYFNHAMSGQNAISEITYTDEDGDEVLVLAVPIIQNDIPIGLVFGTFTKDILNSLIDTVSFAESGSNLLVDADGTILARSADSSYIEDSVLNINEVFNTADVSGNDSLIYFRSGNTDMLAVMTPVGVHDWNFVTILPQSVISDTSSRIAMSLLKVVLSVAVSFLLLLASIIALFNQLRGMTADKERITAELNVATKIQSDMMPYNFPERDDIELYATMTPAKEVGGDFYDFFFIDDDSLAMIMADVSGKGMPAALFMVIAKSVLRNICMVERNSGRSSDGVTSHILGVANNVLCENNRSGFFVTTWLGILTISTGELRYTNAGHEYPALRRSGGNYELLVTDNCPPLATMEDLQFEEEYIKLEYGDIIFLYTDGVPEAKNAEAARFGTDRMLEILNSGKHANIVEMLTDMKNEIDKFTGEMDPFDDVTMMCMKYTKKS
ncbi:MAG: SpoIIE family protein phosphatase [Ruminiclostridium sp.]|nr:SpoIIE family protein phosphatase [Ruminiclostridium sp.]